MKKKLINWWLHFRSETPKEFKRLRNLALLVASIDTAILALPVTFSPKITAIVQYSLLVATIVSTFIMTLYAQSQSKDNDNN